MRRVLIVGVAAMAFGAVALGQSRSGAWGEEAPGLCGAEPQRKPVPEAKCPAGKRPKWVCRKWYNGTFWMGTGWVVECR